MDGKFFKISTGQLLKEPTPPPEAPARPGYGFEEARRFLSERFQAASESVRSLPAGACPDGYLVVEMVRHPDRLDKREFPGHFLQYLGLTLLGSRNASISPRGLFERPEANPNRRTVKLYVAGPQAAFAAAADKCRDIWPDSPAAAQMTCLETVSPVDQADLVTAPADLEKDTFDVTLFVMPRRDDEEFPFRHFCAFAAEAGYEVKEDYRICSGGLLSVPVYGPRAGLAHLARFVFVRQIEEVARLRPFETPLPPGPRPD